MLGKAPESSCCRCISGALWCCFHCPQKNCDAVAYIDATLEDHNLTLPFSQREGMLSGACLHILSIVASTMVQAQFVHMKTRERVSAGTYTASGTPRREVKSCRGLTRLEIGICTNGPRGVSLTLLTYAPNSVGVLGGSASMKRESSVSFGTGHTSPPCRAELEGRLDQSHPLCPCLGHLRQCP